MGSPWGKVVAITEDYIQTSELVPDGEGGWMEREASLSYSVVIVLSNYRAAPCAGRSTSVFLEFSRLRMTQSGRISPYTAEPGGANIPSRERQVSEQTWTWQTDSR